MTRKFRREKPKAPEGVDPGAVAPLPNESAVRDLTDLHGKVVFTRANPDWRDEGATQRTKKVHIGAGGPQISFTLGQGRDGNYFQVHTHEKSLIGAEFAVDVSGRVEHATIGGTTPSNLGFALNIHPGASGGINIVEIKKAGKP